MGIAPDRYLLISTGDPAGIGPEICIKALESLEEDPGIKLLPVGNLDILRQAAALTGNNITLRPHHSGGDANPPATHEVLDVPLENTGIPRGEVSAEAGKHVYQILATCSTWCRQKKAVGLVTCPINKASLKLAGYDGMGHTELLARLAGTGPVETVFCVGSLKIFFLTRHISLRQALCQVKGEKILSALVRMDRYLKSLGNKSPRLGVPGLNPHCGGICSDQGIYYML